MYRTSLRSGGKAEREDWEIERGMETKEGRDKGRKEEMRDKEREGGRKIDGKGKKRGRGEIKVIE